MALQAIAVQLGIGLGLWGAGKLASYLSPTGRPVTKEPPKALRLPRAGKGTVKPLVYGITKIETPPILWAGNNFVANDDESPTTGSYRRIDLLLCAGIPMSRNIVDWYVLETPPRLMAVWINGRRVPLGAGDAGITHGQNWQTGSIDLGGRGAGGNFRATIEFFDGRDGQDLATGTRYGIARETANLGIPIDPALISPHARQMCVAILMSPGAVNPALPLLEGTCGEGDSLISIALEVQALGTEAILTDGEYYEANPAMMLLDLVAGDVWKLGYPVSSIDVASFTAAADTLATEGFGMSGAFATRGPSARLISEILDTINAIIFTNHATGKLTLKLIRNDYNPATVFELNDSNCVGDPGMQYFGWEGLVNQVDVEFTDRSINWVTNLATAQRGASAVGQGGQIRPKTAQYPAITSAAVARTAAARELGIAARPLMAGSVKVNRTACNVGYGDVVRGNWTDVCEDKLFRVVGIGQGTRKEGTIELELIEDVFSGTYGGLPPWTPPWGSDPPFEIPDHPDIDPG